MCIRDRRTTRSLLKVGQQLLIVDEVGESRVVVVLMHNSIPVSYTHLRAHETVLDLVCRLLLEKKNNQKLQHILTIHLYNDITLPVCTNNNVTEHS